MNVERLTKRYGSGIVPHKFGIACSVYCDNCSVGSGNCEDAHNMVERLANIEDILGDTYDLDWLRELVEADKDGRCMVLPFKPHKTMWSCSKSNPKPAKAYYATEMGILADMKAGCVFGETPEAAEAALANEATP